MINVSVNGEKREFSGVCTLTELLRQLDFADQKIAVELNLNVVRRKDWEQTKILGGEKIEIIHFVGGG